MQIAMITVDRTPQYVQNTLASLFEDPGAALCKVRVCVGGATAAHLGAWAADPRIAVETMGAEEAAWSATKGVQHRAAINSARAVKGEGALLFCHDDVRFTSDWTRKLQCLVDDIGSVKEEFVLSLWSSDYLQPREKGYIVYDPWSFYGDIAYYVSPKARARLKVLLWEDGYEQALMPADLLVRKFCLWSCPLFVAVPNLVQHMGGVSTGCSDHYPTSPTFQP